ncbi:MAG: peptidylprolyl isomerase, partial [Tissierellia bacterium]|nr:peptidylprolyl isomerase [Tissierellia bacterium]
MEQNKVLATVNGKEISSNSVYAFINQMAPQTAAQFRSPEGMKKIANELVNQELLYLEA